LEEAWVTDFAVISLPLCDPFTNNLKDIPWLRWTYVCICEFNFGSVTHNGDFVASDLVDENLR